MSVFINRNTKQLIRRGNTPDFVENSDWIILQPDDILSFEAYPNKYWNIVGDIVSLMNASERDVVDAVGLVASRDATVDSEIDNLEGLIRALASVIVDEINILRAQHGSPDRTLPQLKNAMRNKVGM